MTTIALRTLVAGTIACLMTACVAGEIGNESVVFVVLIVFSLYYKQIRSEIMATYGTRPLWVCEHRLYRGGIRWTWSNN